LDLLTSYPFGKNKLIIPQFFLEIQSLCCFIVRRRQPSLGRPRAPSPCLARTLRPHRSERFLRPRFPLSQWPRPGSIGLRSPLPSSPAPPT